MTAITLAPVKKVLEQKTNGIRSRSHLYKLLKDGCIEARKVGARTHIVVESVERWKSTLPAYVPLSQRPGK